MAGRIITPVRDVYRKIRMLLSGDAKATFGLDHLLPATANEVLDALESLGAPIPAEGGERCCTVSGAALVHRASQAADRLKLAADRGERVLFGTGHPAGPIDLYMRLATALQDRGATILVYGEAEPFRIDSLGRAELRYVGNVACLHAGGELLHTHSPRPMEYLLEIGPRPDLIVGDHGFVGAGLAAGAEAVALVDTNDPALALAWARGLPIWPIVCDDNRPPGSYAPLADFIEGRL